MTTRPPGNDADANDSWEEFHRRGPDLYTDDGWSRTNAPSMVGRQYSCLRAMFAHAEEAELIGRSPCRGIRLPRVRLVDRPQLDADVLNRVTDAVGLAHGILVWLGAVLRLRWGEAAGLTVGDVDVCAGR